MTTILLKFQNLDEKAKQEQTEQNFLESIKKWANYSADESIRPDNYICK